jgi:hypothetical protein
MAPFASMLPMLVDGPPDASLAGPLTEARQQLANAHRGSGDTPPALDVMVGDFAWYHTALAVVAAVVMVVLVGLTVLMWRRFTKAAPADRRTRLAFGWFGGLSALSSLMMVVLIVANLGTARDPAPALLDFFNGGF